MSTKPLESKWTAEELVAGWEDLVACRAVRKPQGPTIPADEKKTSKRSATRSPGLRSVGPKLPFDQKLLAKNPLLIKEAFDVGSMDALTLKTIKSFFFSADKEFPMAMGLTVAQGVSGAGTLSGVISINLFNTCSEYASALALFDEVYVQKVVWTWMPYNPTLGPLPYVVGTSTPTISSVGCSVLSLFHGATGYSGFGPSLANSTTMIKHTSRPFKYTWVNNEKKIKAGPDIGKAGVVIPIQGWCPSDVTATGGYTGQIQILGSKNLSAQYFSLEIGVWAVQFDLYFRNRA